jgi:hypothetical protein
MFYCPETGFLAGFFVMVVVLGPVGEISGTLLLGVG